MKRLESFGLIQIQKMEGVLQGKQRVIIFGWEPSLIMKRVANEAMTSMEKRMGELTELVKSLSAGVSPSGKLYIRDIMGHLPRSVGGACISSSAFLRLRTPRKNCVVIEYTITANRSDLLPR